jgi:hypothetical protein
LVTETAMVSETRQKLPDTRVESLRAFWFQIVALGVAVLFGVFSALAYSAAETAISQAQMANQLAVLSLCAAGSQDAKLVRNHCPSSKRLYGVMIDCRIGNSGSHFRIQEL